MVLLGGTPTSSSFLGVALAERPAGSALAVGGTTAETVQRPSVLRKCMARNGIRDSDSQHGRGEASAPHPPGTFDTSPDSSLSGLISRADSNTLWMRSTTLKAAVDHRVADAANELPLRARLFARLTRRVRADFQTSRQSGSTRTQSDLR